MKIDSFHGQYAFLSNFYLCDIEFEGLTYPSVENAYQASKTTSRHNRKRFLKMGSGQAKRAGRNVYMESGWFARRIEIMRHLVRQKFSRHSDLRKLLLETDDAELVEGNNWGDTFWGVDMRQRPPRGENQLGKILMEIRDELRQKEAGRRMNNGSFNKKTRGVAG